MKLLIQTHSNALTRIKSTNIITTDIVLTESKWVAAKVKVDTGKDVPATFTTCADAKEEANSHNYTIQATISTKQGMAKAISNILGMEVNDQILSNIDGSLKGIDEFLLYEIIHVVHDGSMRPTKHDIISLLTATIRFEFNFC